MKQTIKNKSMTSWIGAFALVAQGFFTPYASAYWAIATGYIARDFGPPFVREQIMAFYVTNQASEDAAQAAALAACVAHPDYTMSHCDATSGARASSGNSGEWVAYRVDRTSSDGIPSLQFAVSTTSAADARHRLARSTRCPTNGYTCGDLLEFQDVINATPTTTMNKNDDKNTLLWLTGGVVAGGLVYYFLKDNHSHSAVHSFSPVASYVNVDGKQRYEVGIRQDYQWENWSAFTQMTHVQDNMSAFSYSTKIAYSQGLWKAAFENKRNELESASSFQLSSNHRFGGWNVLPDLRVTHEMDSGKSEFSHGVNLQGSRKISNWTVSPSAGFSFHGANQILDNAQFNLRAVYDF